MNSPISQHADRAAENDSRSVNGWDVAAAVFAASLVLVIAVRWHRYQWDFAMFRWSATDFLAGKDPYRGQGLSFFHPPIFLHLYGFLAKLPYAVGYEVWLLAKIGCLATIVTIWNRHFVRLRFRWHTILFFVFAFNGALYADLVSGNVSLFEQLGIWLGFALLLRGHPYGFAVCLALASQWKGTPLLLLAALLVDRRPNWLALWTGLAIFTAIFSLNPILHPDLFARFRQVVPMLDERAPDNPCLLAFCRDALFNLSRTGLHLPGPAANALYAVTALGIALFSARTLWRYRSCAAAIDTRIICLFLCVTLALISPRFKTYSCVLVLIPCLHAIRRRPRELVPIVAVFALAANGESLLPFRDFIGFLTRYVSLIGIVLIWVWYIRELNGRKESDTDQIDETEVCSTGVPGYLPAT